MRRRYWLTALLLALSGVCVYCGLYAFSFTALLLMGCAAVVAVFGLLEHFTSKRVVRVLRWCLRGLLSFVLLAAIVTGAFIAAACGGAEEKDEAYVIVLGAGVNGTAPSRSLAQRIAAAENYLQRHPEAIAVLSGGKGGGERISEAQCMYNEMTAHGIAPERLRMEPRASTTEENLRFSMELIEAESGSLPKTAAIVSSEYHLFRACLLAKREGLQGCGIPAHTGTLPFFCNMFLREICGVWYTLVFY